MTVRSVRWTRRAWVPAIDHCNPRAAALPLVSEGGGQNPWASMPRAVLNLLRKMGRVTAHWNSALLRCRSRQVDA